MDVKISEKQMIDLLKGKLKEMSIKLKMAIDTASEANDGRKVAQAHFEKEKRKADELSKILHHKALEMQALQKRTHEVEKEATSIVNGYLKKREKWTGRISLLEEKIAAQQPQR